MITQIDRLPYNHQPAAEQADLRAVHRVLLTAASLKYVLIQQSVGHTVLTCKNSHGNTLTRTHIPLVPNLGELSVCVLWFLSVSLMRRRLLSATSPGRMDGKSWMWMSGPTFHLEAGYPLSKHRTQLTNDSDRLFLGSDDVREAFSYSQSSVSSPVSLSFLWEIRHVLIGEVTRVVYGW